MSKHHRVPVSFIPCSWFLTNSIARETNPCVKKKEKSLTLNQLERIGQQILSQGSKYSNMGTDVLVCAEFWVRLWLHRLPWNHCSVILSSIRTKPHILGGARAAGSGCPGLDVAFGAAALQGSFSPTALVCRCDKGSSWPRRALCPLPGPVSLAVRAEQAEQAFGSALFSEHPLLCS